MKNQADLVQRWDDIIFKNRNKSYGAYAIRKDYNSNVIKAEAISIGIGALIFMIPVFIPDKITPDIPVIAEPKGRIVLEGIKIKREQPSAKTTPVKRANASVIPTRITTLQVPEEPPAPQTTEVGYTAGTETAGIETGPKSINEFGTGTIPPEVTNKPFDIVEIMPEYEGGDRAMMKFLQKKLRYPSRAIAAKQHGTVYVRFTINADGRVSDVEVVKGFFKDCDEEAARVVSLMTNWKPGIQNKMPVPVRKVLPITFRLDL
ncbi:MAG: TonB family protein [Cyclobacteriaceae bacterium]